MLQAVGQVEQAVLDALDAGYRHIDTALLYESEGEVGRAIRAKIDQGVVKREDVYVCTKVGAQRHLRGHAPVRGREAALGGSRAYERQSACHTVSVRVTLFLGVSQLSGHCAFTALLLRTVS